MRARVPFALVLPTRTLLAAAAALFCLSCESEPPYQSPRCKDLRARVRKLDELAAQRARDNALFGTATTRDPAVDARIAEWMDESPECFDPSL